MTTTFRINNDLLDMARTAYNKTTIIGTVDGAGESLQEAFDDVNCKIAQIVTDVSLSEALTLSKDMIIEIQSAVTLTFATNAQINLAGYSLTIRGNGGIGENTAGVMQFTQSTSTLFKDSAGTGYLTVIDCIINQNSPTGCPNACGLIDHTVSMNLSGCIYRILGASAGTDIGYLISGGTNTINDISIVDVTFKYSFANVGALITAGNCTDTVLTDCVLETKQPIDFVDVSGGLVINGLQDQTDGVGYVTLYGNNTYTQVGGQGGTSFNVTLDGPTGSNSTMFLTDCSLYNLVYSSAITTGAVKVNNCRIGNNVTATGTATFQLVNSDVAGATGITLTNCPGSLIANCRVSTSGASIVADSNSVRTIVSGCYVGPTGSGSASTITLSGIVTVVTGCVTDTAVTSATGAGNATY